MKVAIASDHGGYTLKTRLAERLRALGHEVTDLGSDDAETSVDYPDYAGAAARHVAEGRVDQAVVICTTGVGVSMVANKYPRVRAALCMTPHMAEMARKHNQANVLALGQTNTSPEEAEAILDAWLGASFEGGRHERRVKKMMQQGLDSADSGALYDVDPEVYGTVRSEAERQLDNLELIASENYTSRAVREAVGSVLTNKYAEGYPGRRWYNGCAFVDEAERLAIDRARSLFGAEHVNVQPHSGSGANMAVYFSVLEPGDTLMAMSLADGGHLTHGHSLNFSGRFYRIVPYGVDRKTEQIDYAALARTAEEHRPRMICAGASAYSRLIDFERLREIADSVGAYLMVDMAHVAGLVAAGCHPNPVPHADFVTTTTHKTLRGPRGGMVLCRESFAADLDRQVFPGLQGGPMMHGIAGKAVCLLEASRPAFREYQQQVVRNAQTLAGALDEAGLRIVSGGTDNHLMLVDLSSTGVTGKEAASALDEAGITVNKNAIPFDTRSPFVTSGIRVGTPAVTTRGMREEEMNAMAGCIREVLSEPKSAKARARVRERVLALTSRFPVP